MGRDLNTGSIVGRLTRDIDVKFSQSGNAVAKLSIANNRSVKKDGAWVDEVSYFDVVIFGKQAENCGKFLKKGSQIGVSYELVQNRWVDKDGQNRSKVELVANSVQFLSLSTSNDNPVNSNVDVYSNESADSDIPW